MRVGVAYVDVRVNMAQYKTDLNRLVSLAKTSADRVNANLGKIGAAQTRLGRSSTEASTGMDRISTSAKKQKKSLIGLLPHVAAVTASYMAMRSAWRGLAAGVGAGVQFEQKMAVVEAVSRATAEEFRNLEAAAKEMALGTVFTATQTADALKFLSMAGFEAKESIAALPGVLNLALIGELELGRATDIVTDTLRAFGMEADEINRATDVMVATITRSNTNIEMLGQAMKFAAPVAKALGYEIEQVSAMIGVLAQSGVKAGIAGRNLQQAFVRTQKAARGLGLTIGSNLIDVLKKYKEMQEELTQAYGRTAAAEKINAKITKDYGLIALKSVLILKDNIKGYEELAKAAYLSAGETEMAAYIMQDTVDSQFKILKSIIADISIAIFDEYKDGLKDLLYDTGQWFKGNKESFQDWANAIIASLQAVSHVIGMIIKGWKELFNLAAPPDSWLGRFLSGVNPIKNARYLADVQKIKELGGEDKLAEIAAKMADSKYVFGGFARFREEAHELRITLENVAAAEQRLIDKQEILDRAAGRAYAATVKIKEGFEDFDTGLDDWRVAYDKAVSKVFEGMPQYAKDAYKAAKELGEYEKELREKFGAILDMGKLGPDAAEAAKYAEAAIQAMVREHKKGINKLASQRESAQKKALSDIKSFQEQTARLVSKTEGDKYDVLKTKADQWLSNMLAAYDKSAGALKSVGVTKERILKEYHDGVKAIEEAASKWRAEQDEKDRKKEEREAFAHAKRVLSIRKDLLSEMKESDEGYFELRRKIIDEEHRLLVKQNEGMKETLDDIHEYQIKALERDERLKKSTNVFEGIGIGLEEYLENLKSWGEQGKEIFDTLVSEAHTALGDTFYHAIKGDLDSFSDIWYSFLDSMLKAWTDAMAEMAMQWFMKDVVKGGMGGLFGIGTSFLQTAAGGGLSTYLSDAFSGTWGGYSAITWHKGGKVGFDSAPSRAVDPSVFFGAKRYHGGLMPDEVPSILQKGEIVLPKGSNIFKSPESGTVTKPTSDIQTDNIAHEGFQKAGDNYNVTISAVDARSFSQLMERNPSAILSSINRALEKNPPGRSKLKRMIK